VFVEPEVAIVAAALSADFVICIDDAALLDVVHANEMKIIPMAMTSLCKKILLIILSPFFHSLTFGS
jgi:hypothetical protein